MYFETVWPETVGTAQPPQSDETILAIELPYYRQIFLGYKIGGLATRLNAFTLHSAMSLCMVYDMILQCSL